MFSFKKKKYIYIFFLGGGGICFCKREKNTFPVGSNILTWPLHRKQHFLRGGLVQIKLDVGNTSLGHVHWAAIIVVISTSNCKWIYDDV